MSTPIAAIDFDGTIVLKRPHPAIGPENPTGRGSLYYLKRAQDVYQARLILWTCRSDADESLRGPSGAVVWCALHGLNFWQIAVNPNQESTGPKVKADLYVDDLALGAPLITLPDEKPCVDWSIAGPMFLERCEQIRTEKGRRDPR